MRVKLGRTHDNFIYNYEYLYEEILLVIIDEQIKNQKWMRGKLCLANGDGATENDELH